MPQFKHYLPLSWKKAARSEGDSLSGVRPCLLRSSHLNVGRGSTHTRARILIFKVFPYFG